MMARPIAPVANPRSRATRSLVSAMVIAVFGLIVIVGGASLVGRGAPTSSSSPSPLAAVVPPSTPPPTASSSATARPSPSAPTPPSSPPAASERPTARATAAPTPGPTSASAPASASGFDLESQVIAIGFPLRPSTRYRYRDNWLGLRDGAPQVFNHARYNADGELVRLHDGIDIYAQSGEPVVAPFDGTVVNPAARWRGWLDDRYGLTVAIISSESGSEGYTALLTHLERAWVDVGQTVKRGEILGVLGTSGNAEGVHPQLHFELRAPFKIDWKPMGEARQIDAFNPYPSLVRADPKR